MKKGKKNNANKNVKKKVVKARMKFNGII